MSNTQRFVLPLSRNYVSHWGLWEAVREILQNAYDQEVQDSNCTVEFKYDEVEHSLSVSTSGSRLSKSSLVFGNTNKTDERMIGKFGEGYKLALLVLTRLEHTVKIINQDEIWLVAFEHDHDFDSEVLSIYVSRSKLKLTGVLFKIYGVSSEQYASINENIYRIGRLEDQILDDERYKGRIYVGGLFVSFNKEYKKGYNFSPKSVQLDRDRGTLDGFNLSYATSKLWAAESSYRSSELVALLMDQANDVQYVDYHPVADLPKAVYNHYVSIYGEDTIPVTNQKDVEKVIQSGRKWTLVPEIVWTLINKIKNIFILTTGSPIQRLKDFEKGIVLTEEKRLELLDIIRCLEETSGIKAEENKSE